MSTDVATDQVLLIARDVFASMIDGEDGHLNAWEGETPVVEEPVHAWVDLFGELSGRAVLTTATATAHDLARALLGLPADEEVSHEDLVDAFGELANVVGGNIKALMPDAAKLGLPAVADTVPLLEGALRVQELALSWRGRPIVVELWVLLTGGGQ